MADINIYKQAEVAIKNAYGIFLNHEERLSKATSALDSMIQKAEKSGMDDDLYNNAGILLKKLNTTIKTFNDERKPVTQAAQSIVKAFTAQENAIDLKAQGTKAFALKKLMDDYATLKEAERQKKEAEERLKMEKEREKSTVQIAAMTFLEKICNKAMSEMKADVTAMLNSVSLENYEEIRKKILAYDTRIPESLFGTFDVEIKSVYIGKDEKKAIVDDIMEGIEWSDMQEEYTKEAGIFIQESLAGMPTIKKELEEIAAADFTRAEELKKEKMLREFQENKRMEEEKRKAQEQLDLQEKKKMRKASLQAEFEFGSSVAEIESGVKSKSSYKIELTLPVGLYDIVNFWVAGQEWPMEEEKVMRVTFERMVKFAENEASRNDNFIKSDYVKYKPIVQSKL